MKATCAFLFLCLAVLFANPVLEAAPASITFGTPKKDGAITIAIIKPGTEGDAMPVAYVVTLDLNKGTDPATKAAAVAALFNALPNIVATRNGSTLTFTYSGKDVKEIIVLDDTSDETTKLACVPATSPTIFTVGLTNASLASGQDSNGQPSYITVSNGLARATILIQSNATATSVVDALFNTLQTNGLNITRTSAVSFQIQDTNVFAALYLDISDSSLSAVQAGILAAADPPIVYSDIIAITDQKLNIIKDADGNDAQAYFDEASETDAANKIPSKIRWEFFRLKFPRGAFANGDFQTAGVNLFEADMISLSDTVENSYITSTADDITLQIKMYSDGVKMDGTPVRPRALVVNASPVVETGAFQDLTPLLFPQFYNPGGTQLGKATPFRVIVASDTSGKGLQIALPKIKIVLPPTNMPPTNMPAPPLPIYNISWPAPSTGFHVQQSPSLVSPVWNTLTNEPALVGSENQLFLGPAVSSSFFRLISTMQQATNEDDAPP
jgi:hypothetical protein